MVILGALIAAGAAVTFLAVGALALFGGADATQRQLLPGFTPDRPGAVERLLSILSLWGPALLVALLCLLAAIKIAQMLAAALVG
jgi:hypothetical protein